MTDGAPAGLGMSHKVGIASSHRIRAWSARTFVSAAAAASGRRHSAQLVAHPLQLTAAQGFDREHPRAQIRQPVGFHCLQQLLVRLLA